MTSKEMIIVDDNVQGDIAVYVFIGSALIVTVRGTGIFDRGSFWYVGGKTYQSIEKLSNMVIRDLRRLPEEGGVDEN